MSKFHAYRACLEQGPFVHNSPGDSEGHGGREVHIRPTQCVFCRRTGAALTWELAVTSKSLRL